MRRFASAANAVITRVTQFIGDPRREDVQAVLDADASALMQGRGAHAYLWEHGDPAVSFGGTLPFNPQPPAGAAGQSGSEPILDVNGGMISSARPSPLTSDPAMAIFADRMRRRG